MKVLKERILRDGKCFEGGILKVDNFINHQMDPILMKSIAVEFVRRFASTNINKVMTIEASGIAPAIMVGYLLELPVVFAKKKKPVTMENMLTTSVYSFTKDHSYDVCVSKDFLQKGDRVLFIDDFLANGNAAFLRFHHSCVVVAYGLFPCLVRHALLTVLADCLERLVGAANIRIPLCNHIKFLLPLRVDEPCPKLNVAAAFP